MPTLLQPGTVRLEEQLAILEALQKEVQTRWRTSDDFGRIDIVVAELLRKGSPVEALSYLDRVRQLFDKIHAKLRSTVDEPAAEASGGNAGRFASTTRVVIRAQSFAPSAMQHSGKASAAGFGGASAAELAALRQQVAEQQSQLDQKDAMLQDLRDLLSARKTFLQESETQQAEMLEGLQQQVETASMQLEAKDRTIAALQQMHTEQVERLAARAEQLEVALGAARASTELSRYDDEDVPDVDRAQAAAAAAAMQQREDAIQLPSPRSVPEGFKASHARHSLPQVVHSAAAADSRSPNLQLSAVGSKDATLRGSAAGSRNPSLKATTSRSSLIRRAAAQGS